MDLIKFSEQNVTQLGFFMNQYSKNNIMHIQLCILLNEFTITTNVFVRLSGPSWSSQNQIQIHWKNSNECIYHPTYEEALLL